MKILNITSLNFRAESKNLVNKDKKPELDGRKGFLAQKEAPYIIGGAAVTAAVVLGIIGHKNGWFSKAGKKIVKNSNEPANETLGHNPLIEEPSVNSGKSSQKVPHTPDCAAPVQDPSADILNFGPWDDSELLEKGATVAKGEVVEEILEPVIKKDPYDIFSQFLKDSYLTEEMTISDNVAEKIKMFFDKIDTKVTGYIKQIHENFLVDNFNGDGLKYRYKNDYISAFDYRIKNGLGSFKDAVYEVLGNSIRLTKQDGKRFMYTFFPGDKGGLKYITQLPKDGENTAIRLTYYPSKYMNVGNSGINSLAKIEYINAKTHRVINSVAIHPDTRTEQKLVVNHPETGKRILSWYRSSEPDNMYYNAILYEDGVPSIHIDTKNNVIKNIKEATV